MGNEIGWGKAFDADNGWGTAPQSGAEIGYGAVVLNSYAGDTIIAGKDSDSGVSILLSEPVISMDRPGVNMYVDFLVNPEVTVYEMTYSIYVNDTFDADGTFTVDGLNWIYEYPASGDWYLELKIWVDSVTYYTYISNILTIE